MSTDGHSMRYLGARVMPVAARAAEVAAKANGICRMDFVLCLTRCLIEAADREHSSSGRAALPLRP